MSKMIQIRNVPDDLHRALKVRAAANGQTLSDYLMGEVREIAKRPSPAEIRSRLLERSPAKVRESPVRALRSERDAR
jgi:antitoxin FitA